jgi:hypothetical protein
LVLRTARLRYADCCACTSVNISCFRFSAMFLSAFSF